MKMQRFIKQKQMAWAEINGISLVGSKTDNGEKCYTHSLSSNLFQEMTQKTKEDIQSGNGNEFGESDNPGKIQALHSSSALTVNVFDYWRNIDDKTNIAKALKIPSTKIESIVFEKKFPIEGVTRIPPNMDVVFNYQDQTCAAIECKFTEPYSTRKDGSGLNEAYLKDNQRWNDLPELRKLAISISSEGLKFQHLHTAQLIKHILGLMSEYNQDKSKFRLIYLYYDSFGEEGCTHEKEIEEFRQKAIMDGITFQSIPWQQVLLKLYDNSKITHTKYAQYLVSRYL